MQLSWDCRSDSSCAGANGAAGGQGEAGKSAIEGNAGSSGDAPVTLDACENKRLDPGESDLDCGGTTRCERCSTGAQCRTNDDCQSAFCAGKICREPTCADGITNQGETDIDCGGSCPPCVRAATCYDQVRNQDESDLDCGGICRTDKRCPIGARCNGSADCETWLCSAAGKCLPDTPVPATDVIDDFEDGDVALPSRPALGGRVGTWYSYGDGTGHGDLSVSGVKRGANSVNALHVKGEDFRSWGSGVGVDLNNSPGQSSKLPYDAAAYAGISFWARARSTIHVKVSLPNVDTDPAGKTCTTCEHHYYRDVQVTTDWQRLSVDFSDLVLEPGGVPTPTAFNASGLIAVRFAFMPGQSYDLYLDDLAFVKN